MDFKTGGTEEGELGGMFRCLGLKGDDAELELEIAEGGSGLHAR